MARPRPRAVVRLRAKTETGTNNVNKRSTARVPTTATPPITSGSTAASAVPKTISRANRVRGTATDSAIPRSWDTCWLIW